VKTRLRALSVFALCIGMSLGFAGTASAVINPTGAITQAGNRVTVDIQNGDEEVLCTARARQGTADSAFARVQTVPAFSSATLTFELAVAGVYDVSWECFNNQNAYATSGAAIVVANNLPQVSAIGPFEFSTGSANPFASPVPNAQLTQVGNDVTWRVIAGDTEVNCRARVFDGGLNLTETQTYVVPARVAVNLTVVVPYDGEFTTYWTCFTPTATWGNELSPTPITVPGNVTPQFGSS
jgi:hypothetical protein